MSAGKSFSLFLALILMSVVVSAHRPIVADKHETNTKPSSMEKMEDTGKWKAEIKRVEPDDDNPVKSDEVGSGLYDYQGAGTGFHFKLGPFVFGFGGGVGFGNEYPLYFIPYSQPYVVVSPYSVPYTYPYSYPGPYQESGSGYGSPQPRQYPFQQGPDQNGWGYGYGSPGSSN